MTTLEKIQEMPRIELEDKCIKLTRDCASYLNSLRFRMSQLYAQEAANRSMYNDMQQARKLAEEWRDCACLIHKEGGFLCRPTWPGGLPWKEEK